MFNSINYVWPLKKRREYFFTGWACETVSICATRRGRCQGIECGNKSPLDHRRCREPVFFFAGARRRAISRRAPFVYFALFSPKLNTRAVVCIRGGAFRPANATFILSRFRWGDCEGHATLPGDFGASYVDKKVNNSFLAPPPQRVLKGRSSTWSGFLRGKVLNDDFDFALARFPTEYLSGKVDAWSCEIPDWKCGVRSKVICTIQIQSYTA